VIPTDPPHGLPSPKEDTLHCRLRHFQEENKKSLSQCSRLLPLGLPSTGKCSNFMIFSLPTLPVMSQNVRDVWQTKTWFTRHSFHRASSQRHRIFGWENPGVLTSYTLVSVLVVMYVHVVTANPSGFAAAPSRKCECSLPF
jgi:hypothetical protein